MNKQEIKLEEIKCLMCADGVFNHDICPLCSGYGVLFRISGMYEYSSGSHLYIKYEQRAS